MSEMTEREVLVSLRDVEISFDNGGKTKFKAVQDANFDIYKGETFALVGESGSGKTTIGRAIMRINELSKGEITFEGKRISGKLSKQEDTNVIRNIQMIFQDPAASLNERATIEYIISEGLYNFHLYKDEADRLAKVDRALEEVGLLPEHKSRYPHEFSGGQRQRVGIARALIMEPKLVVAVRFIADRIAVIHLGRIVEIAETEELFAYPLHPYTISLLSAVPMPDPIIEKQREPIVYADTTEEKTGPDYAMREIRPGHYVYCTPEQAQAYIASVSQ